jgi:LuxR family maltose regulon positive regulatory protein
LIGLAQWSVGDLEAARQRYADAVELFVTADYIPDVMGVSLGLADIQIAQGNLRDAQRTYESALALAAGQPGLRGTADMHVGLAEVLIATDRLAEAGERLQVAAALGEQAGLPQHPYRWRVATALLCEARNDVDEALELLSEARHVYHTDFSPPVRPVPAVMARAHLMRGDVDAALEWVADQQLRVDDELSYVREFEHITLARVLIATSESEGPDDSTIGLLDRLLAHARAGHRGGSVIEILTLMAVAHRARGDLVAAGAALDGALVLAAPERHLGVLLDAGQPLVDLLADVELTDQARTMAVALGSRASVPIAATSARANPAGTALAVELSPRERDVLRLLRTDMSGPEIARHLHVSMNTLRTHTKSIYNKLGATNRREAVRLAADGGVT